MDEEAPDNYESLERAASLEQHEINELCDDYAAEISELKAEIKRLRAALETIIEAAAIGDAPHVIVIAKRALKQ